MVETSLAGCGAGLWDAPVISLDGPAAGGHAQRCHLARIRGPGPRIRGHPSHSPGARHHFDR